MVIGTALLVAGAIVNAVGIRNQQAKRSDSEAAGEPVSAASA
jgi:hypothetical protein